MAAIQIDSWITSKYTHIYFIIQITVRRDFIKFYSFHDIVLQKVDSYHPILFCIICT